MRPAVTSQLPDILHQGFSSLSFVLADNSIGRRLASSVRPKVHQRDSIPQGSHSSESSQYLGQWRWIPLGGIVEAVIPITFIPKTRFLYTRLGVRNKRSKSSSSNTRVSVPFNTFLSPLPSKCRCWLQSVPATAPWVPEPP